MKKIETIVETCEKCRFCQAFMNFREDVYHAFICMESQRVIEIHKVANPSEHEKRPRILPDWCPLETYKEAEKSEVQPTAPADNRSTIILPGMPHLEWMTENLTDHGGTEIDGNWYYTWEQAMAAAAELGDGWRLSTAEELQQLCDIGSTWDGKRKGRWFGGNHNTDHEGSLFFPAEGYIYAGTGTVYYVGTAGCYWSSSLNSVDSTGAGHLSFDASSVNPFYCSERAHGLPVRCVREISER